MELGHQNHHKDGLLGPNSIIVVYMDPLGYRIVSAGVGLMRNCHWVVTGLAD